LLSGEKKYYINDLAFRNYPSPRLKTDFAAILENLIFTHLRIAGYQVFTGSDVDYEIDFIAFKNEAPIYLQVAYLLESDKTIAREFGAFKNIKDHFTKYVVSMDELTLSNPEGIKHENIWNFLFDLLKFD
jgi:predicted AAA+ superfamily ATPase